MVIRQSSSTSIFKALATLSATWGRRHGSFTFGFGLIVRGTKKGPFVYMILLEKKKGGKLINY